MNQNAFTQQEAAARRGGALTALAAVRNVTYCGAESLRHVLPLQIVESEAFAFILPWTRFYLAGYSSSFDGLCPVIIAMFLMVRTDLPGHDSTAIQVGLLRRMVPLLYTWVAAGAGISFPRRSRLRAVNIY